MMLIGQVGKDMNGSWSEVITPVGFSTSVGSDNLVDQYQVFWVLQSKDLGPA